MNTVRFLDPGRSAFGQEYFMSLIRVFIPRDSNLVIPSNPRACSLLPSISEERQLGLDYRKIATPTSGRGTLISRAL
jgi:hypothetical protein